MAILLHWLHTHEERREFGRTPGQPGQQYQGAQALGTTGGSACLSPLGGFRLFTTP